MAINTQTITREQVIALAMNMPLEKLVSWYEYGLFILSHPALIPATEDTATDDAELQAELAAWEAASDEDWLKLDAKRLRELEWREKARQATREARESNEPDLSFDEFMAKLKAHHEQP